MDFVIGILGFLFDESTLEEFDGQYDRPVGRDHILNR
jgi:hypothetical protein